MTRLRRFAVALLGVLLLQVAFLGAGGACEMTPPAEAGVAGPHDGAPSMAHHVAGHAHEHEPGHHARDVSVAAGVPAPPDHAPPPHHDGQLHCPSSAACATVAVAAAAVAIPDDGALVATRIGAHDGTVPASVTGAPEPPPPRA